jgi:FkbM family methyltransferase
MCGKQVLFLSILDLRTYQVILPQLQRVDSEIVLAKAITPPEGVLLDVGANVGMMSLSALSSLPGAVFSFEPNPQMMSLLRKTHKEDRLRDKWHLCNFGLGKDSGRVCFYIDPYFSGTASLLAEWQGEARKVIDVEVRTLDEWRASEGLARVDAMKVDVEGAEMDVFQGGQNTINDCRPYIWFEHNVPLLVRTGKDPMEVLEFLKGKKYRSFRLIGEDLDEAQLSMSSMVDPPYKRCNLLAVPPEREEDFKHRLLPAFISIRNSMVP